MSARTPKREVPWLTPVVRPKRRRRIDPHVYIWLVILATAGAAVWERWL